jgi:hypothetical protein
VQEKIERQKSRTRRSVVSKRRAATSASSSSPNGVYTPLDGTGRSEWDRPLTDYYYAGEMGFPVPASPNGA